MEEKKVRDWSQLFGEQEREKENQKRLQEIGVLLSELESVKKESAIYQGTEQTVFFKVNPATARSGLKKEQKRILMQQKEALASREGPTN